MAQNVIFKIIHLFRTNVYP